MFDAVSRQAPLTPSADEAQEWARNELAKAIYNDDPTLLEQVVNWLTDLWDRLREATGSLGPVATPLIVVGVLVALLAVALLIAGPVRRRRRGQPPSAALLDDDERSAAALRVAAESAAGAGNYPLAVLERFRAIVRSLDERAILTDRPGRTAHEAAEEGIRSFGGHAQALSGAARLFDAVCYGHRTATRTDFVAMCELDDRLATARPQLVGREEDPAQAR